MYAFIHTAVGRILSLIFPDICAGCGKEGPLFCDICKKLTRKKVRAKSSVIFLDNVYHWGIYEDEILSKALRRLKYHGAFGLSEIFSEMLAELMVPELYLFKENCLVIPIPASRARKRSRGYNQAELLAEKFSQKTGLPYFPDVLIKSKNTVSQTSVERMERFFNPKGSFSVIKPEIVKNKKIILVDDILTTGATLSEAARVLKEAGALEVTGLVIAK